MLYLQFCTMQGNRMCGDRLKVFIVLLMIAVVHYNPLHKPIIFISHLSQKRKKIQKLEKLQTSLSTKIWMRQLK